MKQKAKLKAGCKTGGLMFRLKKGGNVGYNIAQSDATSARLVSDYQRPLTEYEKQHPQPAWKPLAETARDFIQLGFDTSVPAHMLGTVSRVLPNMNKVNAAEVVKPVSSESVLFSPKSNQKLPEYMEPYLSKKIRPMTNEEQYYANIFGESKEAQRTTYFDKQGNVVKKPKLRTGGAIPDIKDTSHFPPVSASENDLTLNFGNWAKGGLLKRADGSYSKRGLWDNIRANKGSGNKPTKAMLKQEKKIRAQEKADGGVIDNGFTDSTPAVGRYEGGNVIYTQNPNDPRLKAYNDSLSLYKGSTRDLNKMYSSFDYIKSGPLLNTAQVIKVINKKNPSQELLQGPSGRLESGKFKLVKTKEGAAGNFSRQETLNNYLRNNYPIKPIGWRPQLMYGEKYDPNTLYDYTAEYKKPVQPYVLGTPQENTVVSKLTPELKTVKNVQSKVETQPVTTQPVQNETPVETAVERKPKNAISYEPETTNLGGGKGQYVHYDSQGNAHVITEQEYKRLEGKVKHYNPTFKKGGAIKYAGGGGIEYADSKFWEDRPIQKKLHAPGYKQGGKIKFKASLQYNKK